MPFPLKNNQNTQGTTRGISLFTSDEAHKCRIERADKVYSVNENGANSAFEFWIFNISDAYSNTYEWRDLTLSETATLADIGEAIVDHLTTSVYQATYNEYIENDHGILNTITVGNGDEGVDGTVKEAVDA